MKKLFRSILVLLLWVNISVSGDSNYIDIFIESNNTLAEGGLGAVVSSEGNLLDAKIVKPKLYAIVVGTNEFDCSSVKNLRTSENDAYAIAKMLQKNSNAIYSDVEVTYLIGKKATKENILMSAQNISKKANRLDSIVFYISTHGRAYKDNLYMIPYNCKRVKDWIDFQQLFTIIHAIPAFNQVFILDVDDSYKAKEIFLSHYDSIELASRKKSGVHFIVEALDGLESSFEYPSNSINHSMFTYWVLQSMKRKILQTNEESFIPILALQDRLESRANINGYATLYEKAIEILPICVADMYGTFARYFKNKQYFTDSFYFSANSSRFLLKDIKVSFPRMDNEERELYLKKYNMKIFMFLNIAFSTRLGNLSNGIVEYASYEAFNIWLNYKGSIFDSENAIATLQANTKDPVLKARIDDLVSSKVYLAKLYQSLPKPKERIRWKNNIKQTEEKINSLTIDISKKAESFKEQQGLKSISYKDISSNLKDDELYIDYAKAGEYYYVFSLDNKEDITFIQIDINSTKEIDRLVKTFREDVTSILDDESITDEKLTQLTVASKEKLSRLYELTLSRPLSKELSTKQNLIISPDGALRLLPFEAMYDKKNSKYLIEEKEIRYIPSGKELVRLHKYGNKKVAKNDSQSSVIISNPNYDAKDITKVASKETEEEFSVTPNTNRTGIIKSLFKMRFTQLPGTKAEAASIKETLKDKKITEYKEEQANESNLLTIQQPNILHIATHGFFINDNTIPNPMLKSGIALSGANASAIKGKSDGIVTALKLSGLKLKGTDLVVLSACQTGVVDINSTDSVSGLSKAFIQAGAKDIVMSLWSVDDQATKDLMSSFYQEMQNYPSYAKALKEAKLKMIEKDMHPFYWAPFVVSGL